MTTLAGTADVPDIKAPMPWDIVPWPYLVAGLVVLVVGSMIVGAVMRALPGGRRAPVLPVRWRARLRLHPGPGWAGDWELWREMGLPAARKVSKAARRSLGVWDRHRPGGWRSYAVYLGRAHGWLIRRRVFADLETVVLYIIGPRKGKTSAAAGQIIDHDGPVVATSVNGELIANTIAHRAKRGRVDSFNPEGTGDFANTVHWSPVIGCEDTTKAAVMVRIMTEAVNPGGLSDQQFWQDQACMVLSGYLHAAALGTYDMRDVYAWAAGGKDDTPLRVLRQARGSNEIDQANLRHFLQFMPDRTQASVTSTLTHLLRWMQHPGVADVVAPRGRKDVKWLDMEEFLTSPGDTLYLTSKGKESATQPLFSALLWELGETARRVSDIMPGQRLDPVVSLQLDEIANVAPIPVPDWSSWMGGRGVRISVYAQTWSQLVQRFGPMAESLWACAGVVVVGGTQERELASRIEAVTGTVKVRGKDRKTFDVDGKERRERTVETVDVLPGSALKLPRFTAVVLSDRIPPTLVHTSKVWKRPAVRWEKAKTLLGRPSPVPIGRPELREVPEVDPGIRTRLALQQPGRDDLAQRRREREAPPVEREGTGTDGAHVPAAEPGPSRQQRPATPPTPAVDPAAPSTAPAAPLEGTEAGVETQPMPSFAPVQPRPKVPARGTPAAPDGPPRLDITGPNPTHKKPAPKPSAAPQRRPRGAGWDSEYAPPWRGSPMPWDLPKIENRDDED